MFRNKKLLALFSFIFVLFTAATATVIATDPTGTSFDFTIDTYIGDTIDNPATSLDQAYGSTVHFDAGTHNPTNEFALYVVNGKIEPSRAASTSFVVTEEMDVDAYYKPTGQFMVAFLDANQDNLKVEFGASGFNATEPDTSGLTPVPGYVISTTNKWVVDEIGTSAVLTNVTSDIVTWLNYEVDGTASTYTVSVVDGLSGAGTYTFNDTATVTASATSGADNFQYWEMNGMKVSQSLSYTFTVIEDTTVTAIYGTDPSPQEDGLFLNLIGYSNLLVDTDTWIGQVTLPTGHTLVEYGVITSENYPGGITLDTPEINKIQSNKINPDTKEFVRHLDTGVYSTHMVRGYMITTDGATETITYSDLGSGSGDGFAPDLFISEYIEGSSNNKAIEIYNGTGQDVSLSDYTIYKSNNGGSSHATYTMTGTLLAGDVFVLANPSANTNITTVADDTDNFASWNGDDALELRYQGTAIDVIGEVGTQTVWTTSDGGSTQNHTLVRKEAITGPTTTWTSDEWTSYTTDTTTYLGSHTMTATTPTTPTVPTSLDISYTTLSFNETDTDDWDVTLLPVDASTDIFWYSDNPSVATVDADGIVTGVSGGTANIYAYSFYDHSIYDMETVTVTGTVYRTVTFDSVGGSAVSPIVVADGGTISEPTTPTKSGYTFDGWYNEATYVTEFLLWDILPVTQDFTLYAKWVEDTAPTSGDLFISEYGEPSSGTCKYIEIYNPTSSSIDLSAYSIDKGTNGAEPVASGAMALTGTIAAGEAHVYGYESSCSTESGFPYSTITFTHWSEANFNGDDTIGLFKNDVLIDKIGANPDPGSSWPVGNGNTTDGTTANVVLVRISSVTSGETDWTVGAQQWIVNAAADYTDVGTHNATPPAPAEDPVVTLTNPQLIYSVGDTITLGCDATDPQDGVIACGTTDTVDANTAGSYPVSYSATDSDLNTTVLNVVYVVNDPSALLSMDLSTYYDSAEGLQGTALEDALNLIINTGFNGVTYGDASTMLDDTDRDPNNASNLIIVYLQESRDGTWASGALGTWNREHVFPQSLLGVSASNGTVNVASDLHNLKPSDPQENSSRGNDYFAMSGSGTYLPPAEVRGDVARILMYMSVMYNSAGYDLELVDGAPSTYEMGDLATLLAWHYADPVDDFEMDRNVTIYGLQGNRNPFIDYPHFAELLWGDHAYYN